MKRIHVLGAALVLGLTMVAASSVPALAYRNGHMGGWQGMTQEQQAASQQIFMDHDKRIAPLHQQLMAKQAELDALYYGNSPDNAKAQALYKDIADIKAKLFSANADLNRQLTDKGMPAYGMRHGGRGYGNGYCGNGGNGMGYGGHRGRHGGGRRRHHSSCYYPSCSSMIRSSRCTATGPYS